MRLARTGGDGLRRESNHRSQPTLVASSRPARLSCALQLITLLDHHGQHQLRPCDGFAVNPRCGPTTRLSQMPVIAPPENDTRSSAMRRSLSLPALPLRRSQQESTAVQRQDASISAQTGSLCTDQQSAIEIYVASRAFQSWCGGVMRKVGGAFTRSTCSNRCSGPLRHCLQPPHQTRKQARRPAEVEGRTAERDPVLSDVARLQIPQELSRAIAEGGVCHFLLIVKDQRGNLTKFDFGPVGGRDTTLATAEGRPVSPLLLSMIRRAPGCAEAQQAVADTVVCLPSAVRDSKTSEAKQGAPGEIREERLAALPEDSMFLGTAANWDLEAIRRYNAEQSTVYRLNENDCRCASSLVSPVSSTAPVALLSKSPTVLLVPGYSKQRRRIVCVCVLVRCAGIT